MKRTFFTIIFIFFASFLFSQENGMTADEMAKKLQDPLSDLKALQVDFINKFHDGFSGQSILLQPLYTIKTEKVNFVTRQLIPVLRTPTVTNQQTSFTTGLGDWISSVFISPVNSNKWKLNFGPQISLKTRTNEVLAGAGWGGGVTSVLVGDYGNWATATFLSHLWSFENDYSVTTFQPLVFYNFPSISGLLMSYQGEITYDWNSDDSKKLSLPLGLQVGKMFVLKKGTGLEIDLGYYYLAVKPDGAAISELKATFFVLLP